MEGIVLIQHNNFIVICFIHLCYKLFPKTEHTIAAAKVCIRLDANW